MQPGPSISSPLPAAASPFPPRPSAPSSMAAASAAPSPLRALLRPTRTSSIPAHLAPSCFRIVLLAALLGGLAGAVVPHALALLSPPLLARVAAAWPAGAAAQTAWPPQLATYLAAWALFHLLEFEITAGWNGTRLMEDSFLLQNGLGYHLAHLFGLLEFAVSAYFFPALAHVGWWSYLGLAVMLFGQAMRSLAMIHASSNFSHEVAHAKRNDHQLVTSGVYAYVRHPSYVGFFYWALGTQLLLGNPLAASIFVVVLWRFFAHRIVGEEASLRKFFPDYDAYRARVGSGLPFIR